MDISGGMLLSTGKKLDNKSFVISWGLSTDVLWLFVKTLIVVQMEN